MMITSGDLDRPEASNPELPTFRARPSKSLVHDLSSHGNKFYERASRNESLKTQRQADILVLKYGFDEEEEIFLTGKFLEYTDSGRPIIAVAGRRSELEIIIDQHNLGIAPLAPIETIEFLCHYSSGDDVSVATVHISQNHEAIGK